MVYSLKTLPIKVSTAAVMKVTRMTKDMTIFRPSHKREDIAEDIIKNECVWQEIRAENEANIDLDGHINPVDRYKPQDLYAETTPEEHVHRHRHQTCSKGPAEKLTAFKDGRSRVNVALKAYKRLNNVCIM